MDFYISENKKQSYKKYTEITYACINDLSFPLDDAYSISSALKFYCECIYWSIIIVEI